MSAVRIALADACGLNSSDHAGRPCEVLRVCLHDDDIASLGEFNHAGYNALHRTAVGDFEAGALFQLATGAGGCSLMCSPSRVFGATPLHLASGAGRVDAVDELLDAGASVLAPDAEGMLPLHAAIRTLAIVLLTYGPSTTHAAVAASPLVLIVTALARAHVATAHGRRARACTGKACVSRHAAICGAAVASMQLDRTRSIVDDVLISTAVRMPRRAALRVVKKALVWALLVGVHDEAFNRRRHAILVRSP